MPSTLDPVRLIRSKATHTNIAGQHRPTGGSYPGGVYVPATPTSFTIAYAAVVPSSGRELQRLPEERRSVETRTIYCVDEVLVGAQAGANADLLTIDGATWEVQIANLWEAASGAYASLIQRVAS